MADRFPSIEDMEDGQMPSGNDGTIGLISDSTDTSNFLQRERAALGDDADQFASHQQNVPSAFVQDGDDDLMGGGGQSNGAGDDDFQFQSSFPAIDTHNERVAPGGTITGSSAPFLPGISSASAAAHPSDSGPTEEPDVIKEWRERRSLAIQHREDAAAERKSGTIKAAQESIDEFYENYNNKKEKSISQTRKEAETFLAKREDTTAGGTSWERISKLVDVRSGKAPSSAAGKERFRELLLSLQKDESAPGAKGY